MLKKIPQKLALMSMTTKYTSRAVVFRRICMNNKLFTPVWGQIWRTQSLTSQNVKNFWNKNSSDNEAIEFVESKVFEVLKAAAKCDHAKLSRTATFEELGFDSLDEVELVVAMEEHLGLDISNADAEKIRGVMDAIQIFHEYYTKSKQPVKEE